MWKTLKSLFDDNNDEDEYDRIEDVFSILWSRIYTFARAARRVVWRMCRLCPRHSSRSPPRRSQHSRRKLFSGDKSKACTGELYNRRVCKRLLVSWRTNVRIRLTKVASDEASHERECVNATLHSNNLLCPSTIQPASILSSGVAWDNIMTEMWRQAHAKIPCIMLWVSFLS